MTIEEMNAEAKAKILASGREIDPEANKLTEVYDVLDRAFAGVSVSGMLKVVAAYVVDQAFHQAPTYSEGILMAKELSSAFDEMAHDYCRLKLRNFRERPVTREQLKAELEGAQRVMRQNPELGADGLSELTDKALAGA